MSDASREDEMPFPTPLATAAIGSARLEVVIADITTLAVDAIVNAANRALKGGGGVDGAIHRAAGPELTAACRALGGCDTGSAKITPGFRLPARFVIHAVGPIWTDGSRDEDALLAGCYRAALRLARERALVSLAYSAISTGVYGFPPERAARIAVTTVADAIAADAIRHGPLPDRIVFCCFAEASAAHHVAAFRAHGLS